MNTKPLPRPPKKIQTYAAIQAAHAYGATVEELAIRHNIGQRQVHRILNIVLPPSEKEILAQPLTLTNQEKIDAHKRQIDRDFEWRLRVRVTEECDRHKLAMDKIWKERYAGIERVLARRGNVFSKAEYNLILQVIHPDTGAHVSEAKRAEAFRLMDERKIKLLDEKDYPVVHDLVTAREQRRAEQQAKRKEKRA